MYNPTVNNTPGLVKVGGWVKGPEILAIAPLMILLAVGCQSEGGQALARVCPPITMLVMFNECNSGSWSSLRCNAS